MKTVKEGVKVAKVTKKGSPDFYYSELKNFGNFGPVMKVAPRGLITVVITGQYTCTFNGILHGRGDLGKFNDGVEIGDVFSIEIVDVNQDSEEIDEIEETEMAHEMGVLDDED